MPNRSVATFFRHDMPRQHKLGANQIHAIMKGRDTFYDDQTVPITSRSEVQNERLNCTAFQHLFNDRTSSGRQTLKYYFVQHLLNDRSGLGSTIPFWSFEDI